MDDDDPGVAPTGAGNDEQDRAREQREMARRQLLEVESGNVRDLDAAATCECSCHPRTGDPNRHGGGLCQCQWTDHERERWDVAQVGAERRVRIEEIRAGLRARDEFLLRPSGRPGTIDLVLHPDDRSGPASES